MSNAVLPLLKGLTFPVRKTPRWSTKIQTGVSGKETRIGLWSYPIYDYEQQYSMLRSDNVNLELQTLLDFYSARQGSFDTWLFNDPDDNTATLMPFGTGDGVTTAFQLTRTLVSGGFSEPVTALNGSATVVVNGTAEPQLGLSTPATPALSAVAGGALAATTYYVRVTLLSANGQSLASTESSLAVALNNVLQVASPVSQTGATGWAVYVSTAAGTETRQATNLTLGSAWTEPTTGLVAGAALPGANTTGWTVSATGLVTFFAAPANAAALTWTGTYYWRCRFKGDTFDVEKFHNMFWEAKALKFVSVK